jgi:hypothetical protein
MAVFVHVPDLRIAPEGNFVLRGELVYSSDLWPTVIIVPESFVTDFASIPRIFRALHPVNGRHREASIVHDFLVREDDFDRRLADRIFLEAMKVSGVKAWRRYQMYWAVSLQTFFKRFTK